MLTGMPKKRRPGQIPDRTPGLLHAITARAWSPCLYARFAWRCPVPVWKHRAWRSPPNRIACMCAPGVASRCISAAAVIGVRFTAPGTAPRCAAARYQASRHGAIQHAARQRRWRARTRHAEQRVTHQGSLGDGDAGTVAAHSSTPLRALAYASSATRQRSFVPRHAAPVPRCTFCGRALSPFMRLHALRPRL